MSKGRRANVKTVERVFDGLNKLCFRGKLRRPVIKCLPDRHGGIGGAFHPLDECIDIVGSDDASRLAETLLHEMVHLWMHRRHKASANMDHGPEFWDKFLFCLKKLGGSDREYAVQYAWEKLFEHVGRCL